MGLELPEQLGALFLGDAAYLRELTRGTEPLVDDLFFGDPKAKSFHFQSVWEDFGPGDDEQ